jgi:ArsR family transcriptional regulator
MAAPTDLECCPPLTASSLSADEAAATARVFKALANPHRVQLVNLLVRAGFPVCVYDLTTALGLAQSTVSHHLRLLVEAGLLGRKQRGIWAYYSVDRTAMTRLASVVALDEAEPAAPAGRR